MVCTTSAPIYYQSFTNGVRPMCTSSALCVTLSSVSTVCVSAHDFGSLIAFASQLIFVLHDCLNPIGCAPKTQRQVTVYAHERTFLRSMTHCGSIMDSLPEVAFDHKAHRHGVQTSPINDQWQPGH